MDDLFDKLKAEKPVNNDKSSAKFSTIKNSDNEDSPKKFPTKAEKKYLNANDENGKCDKDELKISIKSSPRPNSNEEEREKNKDKVKDKDKDKGKFSAKKDEKDKEKISTKAAKKEFTSNAANNADPKSNKKKDLIENGIETDLKKLTKSEISRKRPNSPSSNHENTMPSAKKDKLTVVAETSTARANKRASDANVKHATDKNDIENVVAVKKKKNSTNENAENVIAAKKKKDSINADNEIFSSTITTTTASVMSQENNNNANNNANNNSNKNKLTLPVLKKCVVRLKILSEKEIKKLTTPPRKIETSKIDKDLINNNDDKRRNSNNNNKMATIANKNENNKNSSNIKGSRKSSTSTKQTASAKVSTPKAKPTKSEQKKKSPDIKIKLDSLVKCNKTRKSLKQPQAEKDGNFSMKKLIEKFGKRTFSARVRVKRCKMPNEKPSPVKLLVAESVKEAQFQKTKKNLSVSFLEKVEVLGYNSSNESTEGANLSGDQSILNATNMHMEALSSTIEEEYILPEDPPVQLLQHSAYRNAVITNAVITNAVLKKTDNFIEDLTNEPDEEEEQAEAEVKEKAKSQTHVLEVDPEAVVALEDEGAKCEEETFAEADHSLMLVMPDEDNVVANALNGNSFIDEKLCNNEPAPNIDLNSEHSNDGVIKNDVMMNGLGSFKSATSDMETHAEKGSDTKLSDITDVSDPDGENYQDSHHVAVPPEVTLDDDVVPMTLDNTPSGLNDGDVEMSVPVDVSGLLGDMDDINDKLSPMEVDKLNATIALIGDPNPPNTELGIHDDLVLDHSEAPSIV